MPIFARTFLLLFFVVALALPALPAQATAPYEAPTAAAAGISSDIPQISARLISPVQAVGNNPIVSLGLEIIMPTGWHTYWRSPGVAGIPPALQLTQQENVADLKFLWPAPIRFSQQGLETFGYKDRVLIPLRVTLQQAGQPLILRGQVDTVICTDICVPANAPLDFTLPSGQAAPSADAALWQEAVAQLPISMAEAEAVISQLTRTDDTLTIDLLHLPATPVHDVIIETPAQHAFKAPVLAPINGGTRASVAFDNPAEASQVDNQVLTLTFLTSNGQAAIEGTERMGFNGPVGGAPAVEQTAASATGTSPALPSLALMLLFGLLGGLILNLMPCVLPVLSLKLLSVINHAGENKTRIRRGFLATSAGILVSFWVLAAATITLQQTGMALGWGIQFQQPLFLAFLIVVVVFFTANMWGFFEIGLPRLLRNKFAAPTPDNNSLLTEFLTGVFATLLATPCTAPFVGTAVGFALSQGATQIMLIFTALGIGLALPYLLVAAFPAIAQRLPKPGHWMRWLKIILGLALLGTALWLLWVLWQQTGALIAGAGTALIALILWALHKQQMTTAILLGFLLVAAPLSLPQATSSTVPANNQTDAASLNWQSFVPATIPQLVQSGKTVFVDITASWCLTCHANKRLVLQQEPVFSALRADNIVLMQGDWTKPDPLISAFLAQHQRYGIPFNMVFSPSAPNGIILPELLSADAVLNALNPQP